MPSCCSPRTSRTPNKPQCELSHLFFGLNADFFRSVFAVFKFPDELILPILSHVSPDPRLAGNYARFRIQYGMEISDYHWQQVQFLRPLSMTCRTMRLRLLPWVWEHIEMYPHEWILGRDHVKDLDTVMNVLLMGVSLATNVRYLCALLRSWAGADSYPPKVHDGAFPMGWIHPSCVRQVSRIPPEPPHAGDRTANRQSRYDPAEERTRAR